MDGTGDSLQAKRSYRRCGSGNYASDEAKEIARIIAWTLSTTLEVSCVIETINKAKARRKTEEPLILHSDRGSQYVSNEYKRVTANMQCSYSKKAYPWDNACIESFHSLIKREWLMVS